jgi:hypothetical protein
LSLHETGFEVLPIDWQRNRHEAAIPILDRDLTDKGRQDQTTKDIAKADFMHAVLFGGAASAARNQKSLARIKKFGIKEPQPFRTKEFPTGKPHLNATDRIAIGTTTTTTSSIPTQTPRRSARVNIETAHQQTRRTPTQTSEKGINNQPRSNPNTQEISPI